MLAFELQAGFSAWLQFTVLPGGPLFMGTMAPSNAEGYISDDEFQVHSSYTTWKCSIIRHTYAGLNIETIMLEFCERQPARNHKILAL